MKIILILAAALLTALSGILSGRRLLHVLQLESYQLPGYFRSLRRGIVHLVWPGAALALVCVPVLWAPSQPLVAWVGLTALQAALGASLWFWRSRQKEKKRFVLTERVRRLLAVHLGVSTLAALLLFALCPQGMLLLPVFEPLLLALAARCAEPIERRINRQFADDARARLQAMPKLIRIGITGSYGKTSTKFLLRDILSVRWNVLATPGSFNTTMGVTRVIREMLTGTADVFIAEMGARHPGDIAELMELVQPTVGILTSIGPQHLDTFGSVEGVAAAKNELLLGLPEEGIAVVAHGTYCDPLYEACTVRNKAQSDTLLACEDVRVGSWGTRFTLIQRSTGERVSCETQLLGTHAIDNLMLCAHAALMLGMTLSEVAQGIRRCKPVEHRLQLIAGGTITIIDDAFNSNPVGAAAAMEVLAAFPGRHVVVTPGMVELGAEEAAYNRALGGQIAAAADLVFLVGKKHTAPIAEGLREAGFPEESLHIVQDLDEARRRMERLLHAGDVVLYENDLPDNY